MSNTFTQIVQNADKKRGTAQIYIPQEKQELT